MKLEDGRTIRMQEIKAANLELVREYVESSDSPTIMDGCKKTGLSYPTFKARFNELRIEKENK